MYSPAIVNKITSKKASTRIRAVGFVLLRYGLVLAIGWIAAMKATEYEAKGIQPLIGHSPLLSWGYQVWTVRHFTMIIGASELIIAGLIAMRHWSAKASAIGSTGAVLMFLTTLSFLFSTPGWEPSLGGFPALSGDVGEFLIKDIVLLGAALWSLSEALAAVDISPYHRSEMMERERNYAGSANEGSFEHSECRRCPNRYWHESDCGNGDRAAGTARQRLRALSKDKEFPLARRRPHFRDYHLMPDEQGDQLFAMTDEIAERARKIGARTIRSIGDIARSQRLKDNDEHEVSSRAMMRDVLDDNRRLNEFLRSTHAVCEEHGDVATASLLENWTDETKRRAWFLPQIVRGK